MSSPESACVFWECPQLTAPHHAQKDLRRRRITPVQPLSRGNFFPGGGAAVKNTKGEKVLSLSKTVANTYVNSSPEEKTFPPKMPIVDNSVDKVENSKFPRGFQGFQTIFPHPDRGRRGKSEHLRPVAVCVTETETAQAKARVFCRKCSDFPKIRRFKPGKSAGAVKKFVKITQNSPCGRPDILSLEISPQEDHKCREKWKSAASTPPSSRP